MSNSISHASPIATADALDPKAPIGDLLDARSLVAQVIGLQEPPAYLDNVIQNMMADSVIIESNLNFVQTLTICLRTLATEHPEFGDLQRFACNALEFLGELSPEAETRELGEQHVMREEFEVWKVLHNQVQLAKSPETPGLNTLLDTYDREFGWWAVTGELTEELYTTQRKLYSSSNGAISSFIQEIRNVVHPALNEDTVHGLLGDLEPEDVREIASKIREDGFVVFPGVLSEEVCRELEQFARTHPVHAQFGLSGYSEPKPLAEAEAEYDTVRFKIHEEDALAREDLLHLRFDPTLAAVAGASLGCDVTTTLSYLGWSRRVGEEADGAAAQLYHYDLNHLNFIKAFVYLTDVDETNGPHCYVRGSHREKPDAIMRDGRVSDDEIAEHYAPEDILELTGKRGTLIIADTRGFHKGKVVEQGQRLVYFLEFAASLAGKAAPRITLEATKWSLDQKRAHPRLWQRIQLRDTK